MSKEFALHVWVGSLTEPLAKPPSSQPADKIVRIKYLN
jgi:hypothetical protein